MLKPLFNTLDVPCHQEMAFRGYGVEELERHLEICIGVRDSYSGVDAESVSSFFRHLSNYDPSSLPDYKREYVPEFYAQLTAIVESNKVSSVLER